VSGDKDYIDWNQMSRLLPEDGDEFSLRNIVFKQKNIGRWIMSKMSKIGVILSWILKKYGGKIWIHLAQDRDQ
jgi:hypothetical protein